MEFLKLEFLKLEFLKLEFLKLESLKLEFLKLESLKLEFLKLENPKLEIIGKKFRYYELWNSEVKLLWLSNMDWWNMFWIEKKKKKKRF